MHDPDGGATVRDVEFDLRDGHAVHDQLPEVTDIYREVYAEPPYNSGFSTLHEFPERRHGSLWDVESFQDRTVRQTGRDGFAMVTARLPGGELIGYSFGLTFPAGRR